MSGWFSVKHGITSHPIFRARPERIAVWLWLLDNAVYQDTQHDINGKLVTIKRGQVAVSQRRLSEETGVGRQVIRTFFALLQSSHMINPDPTHGKTVITLCNYEKYQHPHSAPNPAPNPRLTHGQPTKEQINNIPVGKADKSASFGAVDLSSPQAAVWAIGKPLLEKAGVKNPRTVIGRWLKDFGAVELLAALQAADKAGTGDPVPYITATMQGRGKEPNIGDTRTLPDGRKQRFVNKFDGWQNEYV